MERLTFEGNFCDIAMCKEVRYGSFCEDGECSQRKVWERLKQYEDAEADGRMIMLPYKVGDTVFILRMGMVMPLKVTTIGFQGNSIVYGASRGRLSLLLGEDKLGKTVFSTEEEAKAALKGSGSE